MRRSRPLLGRLSRWAVGSTLAAGVLAFALAGVLPDLDGTSRAAGAGSDAGLTAQTDDSVPASSVTMIGATPNEADAGRDETWGVGDGLAGSAVVRYAAGTGWSLGPGLQDAGGQPLIGFQLDTPAAFASHSGPSTLAGQMTADGAGVLAGSVEEGKRQVLLVREPNNPANPFRETEPVPDADLEQEHGERLSGLFGLTRAPLIAPLDEGGHVGALVVPVKERGAGVEERVLHWDSAKREWTVEQIEVPGSATEFRVLGIGASSPGNAWLLAQLSAQSVALFRRQVTGGEASWQPVALTAGGEAGEALAVKGEPITIPGAQRERVQTQVLTVTSQGLWIDGERPQAHASTTTFFKPEGAGGPSLSSWCTLERSVPGTEPCEHTLPESLPTGASRSIAWASSSAATPFGERVIAGLPEGSILRLEGESFKRVLGLGGAGSYDQGATFGAAFSSSSEGWLGNFRLPVHLTAEPASSRLAPWPVSFRHALVAVAPQPGAPVGALSSEALAVGDDGEVARYQPGKGWLPESLLGPGGRREEPRLRAVAWPTPGRAYAVGDASSVGSQMWLWRGETGLWEPDPAAPYNFRGDLLGIAFEPNNPARGYAVGESGVLLGYGKTWTQEPYPEESPCARSTSPRCTWLNASFTSIAFAGSEAIVAYRVLLSKTSEAYEGGLLVNDGAGWHVDRGAQEAMGANVPWAVAGLPDGGAAFGASQAVYEREGAGAGWHASATPFPGGVEPGSLAAFREGGALRVLAAGSVPDTFAVEKVQEAPPGFPPTLIPPYPLASSTEAGVLRQTADGWSDEEHELNNAQQPEGNWSDYDEVFQPDPVSAVMVDTSGSQGWAVGGFVESQHRGVLDTADVDRYPADGTTPLGVSASPLSSRSGMATFAIGGNAQCAAPCAARANGRIGPDVWLAHALQSANIPGVRAFVYTGPRLVSPHSITGPKESEDKISYEAELGRYAEILGGGPIPAYAVGTPTDLDEADSEGSLESAFASFTQPLGGASAARAALTTIKPKTSCGQAPQCQAAYYALESTGPAGTVRVIVLDDTIEVDPEQLVWLKEELQDAKMLAQPAIVVGNADLNAEIAGGNHPSAAQIVRALVQPEDPASAYFFDSPEENVKEALGGSGAEPIYAFGSGTLGYVKYQSEASNAFLGASGFLLGEVNVAARNKATNWAPATARLIPNIGELALEANSGTLLRRSQAALFSGLARRPRAGNRSAAGAVAPETSPYVAIPSYCFAAACASGLFPEYTFSSSEVKIGNFVKQNLAAEPNGREPLLKANGEPLQEPEEGGSSPLFCAFNPGTTTVTITAGGLSYSLPVTVQAGSVREPCGTVPAAKSPSTARSVPVPAPAPAPAPAGPAPASSPPPVLPVPPPPLAITPPARPTPSAAPPFFVPPVLPAFVLPFVPLPVPTPARPTPPSGTSAVTSPVEAPEREEEREAAPESVSNEASAYSAPEHEPMGEYVLGIVILAAFAGASTRRRPRRGRRELRVAPATISTIRAQRRASGHERRWR